MSSRTMDTTYNGVVSDDMGVIPRAIIDIFQEIDDTADEYEYTIHCAFVELYQEKLYDLLSTSKREQSVVDIREANGKVIIPNLTQVKVNDALETTNCLIDASSKRTTGATAMNAHSSRSHAIFTITIVKTSKHDPAVSTEAKFNLVDLAGSEQPKKTGATGKKFKEGVKINQALTQLGIVISTLGLKNHDHVPYRDSKLTRLLQDSLGGNSETLMLACVSPADYNLEETRGTLKYANRAKKIKNKPIVNEDPKQAEINRLKAELELMRVELIKSRSVNKYENDEKSIINEQLQKQLHQMAEKMQVSLSEMAHREEVIAEYEKTVESLHAEIASLKEMCSSDMKDITKMSPEELKQCSESRQKLNKTITNLNDYMNKRTECISLSSNSFEEQLQLGDIFVDDEYIKNQSEHQQQLREIKHVINIAEKALDYVNRKTKLQNEHDQLKEQLRERNGTIPKNLAEELKRLWTEINDMKEQNENLERLLKKREKKKDSKSRTSIPKFNN